MVLISLLKLTIPLLELVRITQNQIADLIQQNKYKHYKKIAIFQHLGCITQFL